MGSTASKQNKDDTCDTNLDRKKHIKSEANLRSNLHDRDIQYPYAYDYLHSQVNNPYASKDSYKSFKELSKSVNCNSSNTAVNLKHTSNLNSRIYSDSERNKCKSSNNHHAWSELYCPVPSKINDKNIVNVQSNFVRNVPFTKEERNLKNQKIDTESKRTANIPPVLSLKVLEKNNFTTMWFSWKNEFLTCMKLIDQLEHNKKNWGIMLLNRLGPFGQEIYRTFTFDDGQANDDIDILLEKFDQYCTFGSRKRTSNEDIDIYINNLKVIVSKYTTDTDEIVKKKILEEIDVEKFTNNAKTLIPQFSFSSDIKSLTLQEVTYMWMKYENVNFTRNEKIDNYSVRNCSKCSLNHALNKCPAYGKQCNKCGNMNHHWSRCPSQYKKDCSYCGESHFYRQCPAYMNECSKCHKLNHFYWMCGFAKVLNCNYCGLSHIASKSACSAVNTICTKCYKRGHVPHKCRKK